LARRYWGNESAVGRQVRLTPAGEWLTVVGIARSVRGTALERPPDEMIYMPLEANDPRWEPRDFAFVVRSSLTPAALVPDIARTLRNLAPAVPFYAAEPASAIVSRGRARTSFLLLLLGIASIIAITLASVGLFGMSAYAVSLRRREIAIRLALGAAPADVRRMVGRQGLVVALAGVLVGIGGTMAVARTLTILLYGVTPIDPLTLSVTAALMMAIAAAATWFPMQSASRIDPARALRAE
jgi:predicted lysophospholipase L1 biosynthesis ABC-type transport system permease subunit